MPLLPGIDMSSSSTSKSSARILSSTSMAVGRLGDDVEIACAEQQLLQPLAQDRVVVGDDDADHGAAAVRPSGKRTSTMVPSPGRADDRRLAAEQIARARAGRPVRTSWACAGRSGRIRTPSSSTRDDESPSSCSIAMSACDACACLAILVSDSCTMRNTAVACACGSSTDRSPTARSHAMPVRCPKFSTSHSIDGNEAQVVEHQRAKVGRDAPRRGDRALQQRRHPVELGRERGLAGSVRFSLHHATSICSIVSVWPSSSCNSRAMRLFSCSRVKWRGGAELLQLLLGAAQRLDCLERAR